MISDSVNPTSRGRLGIR